ncbi:MAG TPA: hypothetical protein ENI48_05245 [Thioploca sp.]|nr:hypothetical protein [Thioploca sp.]
MEPINPVIHHGQLQFAVDRTSMTENQRTLSLLVKRANGSDGPVSVDYATANGSASAGSDYTAQNGTLTWNPTDEGAKAIHLPITDDLDFEGNETFTVTLSNPTGDATLGTSQVTVEIVENDQPNPGVLQFSAPTYTASEGDHTLNLTVTRTGGQNGAVSVEYLANGTATTGSDYTGESGTLTWADGDNAAKSLNIQLIDDADVETTETLTLRLLNPTGGATISGQTQATLSITDNDVVAPVPSPGSLQFAASTYTALESEGEFNSITVTRSGGSDGEVTVQYLATAEGSATADSDYTGASGTLTWPSGDMSAKSLSINLIDDAEVEVLETVKFTLSNPTGGANLGSQTQATLSITDNDVAVPVPTAGSLQFAQANYTAKEEDGELQNLMVNRIGGSAGVVSVQYFATNESTATVNSDYTSASNTLTWADGDSSAKPLNFNLIDDNEVEVLETVKFTLSTPTGGASLRNPIQTTLSITDNDVVAPVQRPGILQFTASSLSANESDGTLNITVTRTDGSDGQVSVQYDTAGASTATTGSDYTGGGSGTLTWSAGDDSAKSLNIILIDDAQVEATEIILFTLSNASGGATLGSPVNTTISITDNDVPPPVVMPDPGTTPTNPEPVTEPGVLQFAAAGFEADEKDGEFKDITVTRSGGSDGVVSVQYLTTGESTATANSDYTGASGTLKWYHGDTKPKTLPLTILDDKEFEETETLQFILSKPTGGATLGSQTQATLSITDNETETATAGVLQFAASTYFVKEGNRELKHLMVNRIGGKDGAVSVQYLTTGDSTATAGSDYTGASGTLTWADGDSKPKPLAVTLLEDEAIENAETVHFKLFDVTGSAELGRLADAKLIIVDNEGEPLPSLGKGSAIPCQPDDCDITAVFKGGALVNGLDYQSTLSISPSELISIIGEIEVDATHVDQNADILVLIQSRLESSETEQFLMVDNQLRLIEWGLEPATLVAAQEELLLVANQPVAIYQGVLSEEPAELLIYFGYRLENGLIVFNGEQPILVHVERDELPSLGQGTAILCPNDKCGPVNTVFRGGASVADQDYQTTLTLSPNQPISITGEIAVSANHVGSKADLLIVAGLTPLSKDTKEVPPVESFYMVDNQKQAKLWDGDPATLVAAKNDVTLAATQPIAIYQGELGDGNYLIYFGYRLENGTVVFNGEQTINVLVRKE